MGRPFGGTGTVAYDVLRGKADDGEKRGSVVRLLQPPPALDILLRSVTHQPVHRDGQETPYGMRMSARPTLLKVNASRILISLSSFLRMLSGTVES